MGDAPFRTLDRTAEGSPTGTRAAFEEAFARYQDQPFLVGRFRIDPRGLSARNGTEGIHRLEPKVLLVLARLAASAGEVVTREELFAAAWPEVHVSENVLSRTISELRKLFGDEAREPHAIETIRARGYRLIWPVELAEEVAATSAAPRQPRQPTKSPLLWAAATSGVVAIALFLTQPATQRPATSKTDPTVLTASTFPGQKWQPRISPDGRRLAVVTRFDDDEELGLFLKDVASEEIVPFCNGRGEEDTPTWSPDGSRIAFVRRQGWDSEVLVAAAAGPATTRQERSLRRLEKTSLLGLSWSPAEDRLVAGMRAVPDAPFRLVAITFDGDLTELTEPRQGTLGDHSPRYSPSGDRIAFLRRDLDGMEELVVMPGAGGEMRTLARGWMGIAGFDWRADGQAIVFSDQRGDVRELWTVPAEGGETSRFPSGGIHAYNPSFSRREPERLLILAGRPDINVWRVSTDGTETLEQVTRMTRASGPPAISTTGSQFVLARRRLDGTDLMISASRQTGSRQTGSRQTGSRQTGSRQTGSRPGPESLQPRLLNTLPGTVSRIRWSPDDRSIVCQVLRDGSSDLYLVDTRDSSPPVRLTDHPGTEVDPSWSTDGTWIYFSSYADNAWRGFKVAVSGGAPVPVLDEPAYCLRESADGQTLYFSAFMSRQIRAKPLSGGPARTVPGGTLEIGSYWDVTATGIQVLLPDDPQRDTFRLVEIDGSSDERRTLARLPGELASGRVSLSPQGWAYFVRYFQARSELLVIDGLD